MASRKNNDASSSSGVSFPAGSSTNAVPIKSVSLSQTLDPRRLLLKNGAFNGHAVEVYADGAVWDTVSNVYLMPGRDFNPHDINRS